MKRMLTILITTLFLSTQLPLVYAELSEDDSGTLTDEQKKDKEKGEELANKINNRVPRFSMIGTFTQNEYGVSQVNGETFQMNKETRIEGPLTIGSTITVRGFIENGQRVARVVQASAGGEPATSAALAEEGEINAPRLDMSKDD